MEKGLSTKAGVLVKRACFYHTRIKATLVKSLFLTVALATIQQQGPPMKRRSGLWSNVHSSAGPQASQPSPSHFCEDICMPLNIDFCMRTGF